MTTGFPQIQSFDPYRTLTSKVANLGDLMPARDGRLFRFAQAGATTLLPGRIGIAAARVANHTNVAPVALVTGGTVAANVGDRQITLTLGATAAVVDQYTDGFLTVNSGAGVGQSLQIAQSPAAASAGTIIIYLKDPVTTQILTTDRLTLTAAQHAGVIVHPGGSAAFVGVGVPLVAVPAGSYYWAQVSGIASVLSDGVIAKGVGSVLTANAVVGALTTEGAGTVSQRLATAIEPTVDTQYYPQYLTIN